MIQIFEMGVRDGLQNEPRVVSTEDKIWFVKKLVTSGIRHLELGAFVRPDLVPKMADTDLVYKHFNKFPRDLDSASVWALVPNLKGLERALQVGAKQFAFFTAASETFTKKNIGMTIEESIEEFKKMASFIKSLKKKDLKFRGYVSTAFGCPFEGKIESKKTLKVIDKLLDIGAFQVSVGDTIGVATPKDIQKVFKPALKNFGAQKLAGHFHDTRGTALANALRSLDLGVRVLDSSAGGLGGCPFAPGATGNLATEDLVYMLNGMGIQTGIDLDALCKVSLEMGQRLNRPLSSRYLAAFQAKGKLQ